MLRSTALNRKIESKLGNDHVILLRIRALLKKRNRDIAHQREDSFGEKKQQKNPDDNLGNDVERLDGSENEDVEADE